MKSEDKDETGFVESKFRVLVISKRRQVPVTSDMNANAISFGALGYQIRSCNKPENRF
jgi:hypothetical protein